MMVMGFSVRQNIYPALTKAIVEKMRIAFPLAICTADNNASVRL
jgi:hypothetical protein